MSVASQTPAYIRAISPYQPGKPINELAREMGIDPAQMGALYTNALSWRNEALATMQETTAPVTELPGIRRSAAKW